LFGGAEKNQGNLNRDIYDRSKFEKDIFRIKTRALSLGTPVGLRQRRNEAKGRG
jgi:hypothetical protein